MAFEVTRIVAPFWPPALESDSISYPYLGHSNLVSDEVYICSSYVYLVVTISGQEPHA